MSSLFLFRFIAFSGILYILYLLVFRRFSFHTSNRWLLLSFPILSIAIPLIAPLFVSPLADNLPSINLPEVILTGTDFSESSSAATLNWYIITYFAIAAASILMICIGLYKALQIRKQAHNEMGNIYYTNKTDSAFTFFGSVIIPLSLKDHKDINTIIHHEQVHVRQWHGLDNLYYQLLTALAWFNPFIHLLAKELRQTHECLADEEAIEKTSREEYAHLLLSSAFGNELNFPLAAGTATPFFNSSLIKTRITMIYKTKTSRHFKWAYLALLPLIGMMTLYSCNKMEEEKVNTSDPTEHKGAIAFSQVDQPPLFPGCDPNASKEEQLMCFQQGIMNHVAENFEFPEEAKKLGMEGKVYAQFEIDQSGEVRNVKIARGLVAEEGNIEQQAAVKSTNQEITKLIEQLPAAASAIKDGKKVAISFTLPINLKLE